MHTAGRWGFVTQQPSGPAPQPQADFPSASAPPALRLTIRESFLFSIAVSANAPDRTSAVPISDVSSHLGP
jgi:hypothetical protein